MRGFFIARKIENGEIIGENGEKVTKTNYVVDKDGNALPAYPDAQIPVYMTKYAAGADFFAAEDTVIPSLWKIVITSLASKASAKIGDFADAVMFALGYKTDKSRELVDIVPTLVHTGIKASMETDEVLELYNRSSNPKKLGLILANSVGVIDQDYYNNESNDGEIMFAFYNLKLWDVTIKKGDRIGQGVFKKYLRPLSEADGLRVQETIRTGGIGSTNK